jgi:hypothetical protein
MIGFIRQLLRPDTAWFDPANGRPTTDFYAYLRDLDAAVRGSVQVRERYFTFADDGKTLDIGNIPEGAVILKPISGIHVIEAFNAGSGNVADIGPSTNTDLWGTNLALGTVGFIPLDEAVSNVVAVGESLVQVAVDLTGTAATTGIARAVISYIVPAR